MNMVSKFKTAFLCGCVAGILSLGVQVKQEYNNVVYAKSGKVHYFTLSGSFGAFKGPYSRLVSTLNKAKRGTRVVIKITHHNGGRNSTRMYISNAILRSKAHVTIHVTRFAASNAALLFRYGNVAIVSKHSAILYHQSFRTNTWGKKSYPKYLYYWSVREHNRVNAFAFMTTWEKKQWYNKKDVVVPGARICRSRFVIQQRGNSCVIRGIK